MENMTDKRPMIGIRFTSSEKAEIEAMCEDAGIPPATLAKKLLLSALEYYRENKDVPMPPAIVRQSEAARLKLSNNETPPARETA
jgi:hypothetical protein